MFKIKLNNEKIWTLNIHLARFDLFIIEVAQFDVKAIYTTWYTLKEEKIAGICTDVLVRLAKDL